MQQYLLDLLYVRLGSDSICRCPACLKLARRHGQRSAFDVVSSIFERGGLRWTEKGAPALRETAR
jgi:hypothetical protein